MIDCAPFIAALQGKPVAVFGLGLSNMAAIRALCAAGATVVAGDDDAGHRAAVEACGARFTDLTREDLSAYACLVLAPGVPLTHPAPHPVVQAARASGIEILCDVEILHRCAHGRKTIGITGTNGKSTTTALLGHVLNACGTQAAVGGNIGTPVLALDMPPPDGVFVLELSSYQLDLCPHFAPDISIYLNLSPDHIDRHGTLAAYDAAKKNIFRGAGVAIVGPDVPVTARDLGARQAIPIRPPANLSALNVISLRGAHNLQNMSAAYEAARVLGVDESAILAAIATFPGLAHRQYPVRVIGAVAYINDSKATNAAATEKALASFDDIHWIVGGRAKDGGLSGLESYAPQIRHAYLIGEAAADFAVWMDAHTIPFTICGTLDQAVTAAHARTQGQAGTVLLSPACASFDQFKNFEQRGMVFSELVAALQDPES